MHIEGKTVLITGAGSGIGAACAKAFAACGASVAVVDRNIAAAKQIAAEISGYAYECDVSDQTAVEEMIQAVENNCGDIDILFNNAGIATGAGLLDTEVEVWEQQWRVNVMSHVFTTRCVLPKMLARGDGYLIQTASMAGYLTSHGLLPYAVTKHAVVGFAEWMSITYHDAGVRTSLLTPLGVKTPMLDAVGSAFSDNVAGSVSTPEQVADMVIEAVQEERFLILTDPIAQSWLERKTNDLERWLSGMRRMQAKIEASKKTTDTS
nr:SDR family NAD(P)-dependent oxidoreductase [Hyphomonas sp. Mor2]